MFSSGILPVVGLLLFFINVHEIYLAKQIEFGKIY